MTALLAYAGISVAGAGFGVIVAAAHAAVSRKSGGFRWAALARALASPLPDAAPFRFGLAGRTPHA